MNQAHMYYTAFRRAADGNEVMLELLFGYNPITDDELRACIARRPHVYGRFAGYLGTRVGDGAVYWGA
jgi:hypothetical protein